MFGQVLKSSKFIAIGVAAAAGTLALSACGTSSAGPSSSEGAGTCPTTPINVVATTSVWGNIANHLAGPCAKVTTIITSPTADPHDFEPDSTTSPAYTDAKLAIENGLGYDAWSDKIIASLGSSAPQVLDLGTTVGLSVGDNPHIWYSPTYVQESAAAITSALKGLLPDGASSFDQAASEFKTNLGPYLDEVASIKSSYSGTPIGSTESIFVHMPEAPGLNLTTPPQFMTAIANDSDPTSQSVATFTNQIKDKQIKVLMYNTQTDGGLPQQMLTLAQSSGVPVVDITETLTPEGATFQQWQLTQLQNLSQTLASGK